MIVVADTSVLINLGKIGRLELLRILFQNVVVPEAVVHEFIRLTAERPNFTGLTLPAWIDQRRLLASPSDIPGMDGLDAGEAEAITLALEIRADAVLLDERLGASVARSRGLEVVGILGVLLRAKQSGHLNVIAPELERLKIEAGFWLSAAVHARVLELAAENGPAKGA